MRISTPSVSEDSRVTAGSVCRGTDDSQPRVTVTTEKNRLSGEMSRMSKQIILIQDSLNYNLTLFHLGIMKFSVIKGGHTLQIPDFNQVR